MENPKHKRSVQKRSELFAFYCYDNVVKFENVFGVALKRNKSEILLPQVDDFNIIIIIITINVATISNFFFLYFWWTKEKK